MNPMTNIKNVEKYNKLELERGIAGTELSWHHQYRDSAWIFIGGINYDLTEGDVVCVFSQFGEIVNINLVRDKKTGKSKGFAFICYENQKSTILAVDNLNGVKLTGRIIRVDHVEEYKVPKDVGTEDDITMKIRDEGIHPSAMTNSQNADNEDEDNNDEDGDGNSKADRKKKKKKKKKKKRCSSNSSDSEREDARQDKREDKAKSTIKTEGRREFKREPCDFGEDIDVKQEVKRESSVASFGRGARGGGGNSYRNNGYSHGSNRSGQLSDRDSTSFNDRKKIIKEEPRSPSPDGRGGERNSKDDGRIHRRANRDERTRDDRDGDRGHSSRHSPARYDRTSRSPRRDSSRSPRRR